MGGRAERLCELRLIELIILVSFVVYRVTRFFLKDSMIEKQRLWFYGWLIGDMTKQSAWRDKIYELFDCPYCFSIWVSAGAVTVATRFVSVPLPLYVWLAGSTGALIVWHVLETDDE